MKKQLIVQATLCALALSSSSVFAGPLTVPNTFTSGEPALAAEVNANFTEINTQVTDNDTRITALQGNAGACPTNAGAMVRVGSFCVDTYEATVYDAEANTGNIISFPIPVVPQVPSCDVTGNECSVGAVQPIYARSDAGVTPTVNVTWFQAAQACANVGKRLITNAEWQTAAAGTPDTADCNISTSTIAATDANPLCVSNWNAVNMVGNVWEITADWVQGVGGAAATDQNGTNGFSGDAAQFVTPASLQGTGSNFMAVISRGGSSAGLATSAGVFATNAQLAPSAAFGAFGFRCAM
ncbi:MAG: hypothetical protein COC05_03305 [Gammaproteobacteria bacterium]|nr:MAG: hypothetical protein COC05_03305 [Gammaproteobacteria bacterium]